LSVIDKEVLRCATSYHVPEADARCPAIVYDPKNISQVLEYVNQELSILDEAVDYASEEDAVYYTDWYKQNADALAEDPTGAVSFVLWESFSCRTEQDCYGCKGDDCGEAKRLGICIAGFDGYVDKKHCFDSLAAKRKKFLAEVAEHAATPAR
jgi:hypothetical protein